MTSSFTALIAGRFLDALIGLLAALCAALIVTGGGFVPIHGIRVEFVSVESWAIVLGLLLWARSRLGASPLWAAFQDAVARVSTPDRSRRLALGILWGFGGLIFVAHVLKHLGFGTHGYDVAFLHPALFRPLGPPLLKCDVCDGGSYLGEHVSYALLAVSPLFSWALDFAWRDFWVFFVQSAILCGSVWAALRAGALRSRRDLWWAAALILFCSKPYRAAQIWDFREDALAFAGLLLSGAFFMRGSAVGGLLSALAAVASKEHVGVIVPFMAAPLLMDRGLPLSRRQRWLAAAVLAFASLAWVVFAFKVLMPMYNSARESSNEIVIRFRQYGSTPREVALNILTSPSAWLQLGRQKLLNFQSIRYVALLLVPFAFFLRRSPWWIVPALPGIGINLVSDARSQVSLEYHYDLEVLPFLVLGMWQGMRASLPAPHADGGARANAAPLSLALLLALMGSGRWPMHDVRERWPTRDEARDAWFFVSLPQDPAVLAVDLPLMAVLGQMPELREMRLPEGAVPGDPGEALARIRERNATDGTLLPGHSIRQATRFALDLGQEWERAAYEALKAAPGARVVAESPSGRYVIVERGL